MSAYQMLIVDDEPYSIQVLQKLLSELGIEAVGAANAEQVETALQTLRNPDVIFLDLQLVQDNGLNILKMLRQKPALASTRIIAYSVMWDAIEKVEKAGFDGFLGKPLNAAHFPHQVQRILAGESVWEY